MRWLDGINGHEFEQAPGDGEGQGSLVYIRPKRNNLETWNGYWSGNTERGVEAIVAESRY